MLGWVPSVVPFLEQARVSLLPLLHGAGTKRKFIQALSIGTPTVSTMIGTEGLDVRDGEDVIVAADGFRFAVGITRLLTDGTLWNRLATQGRERIRVEHSASMAKERLFAAIEAGDTVKALSPQFQGHIYDYQWTVADEINAPPARYRRFRGVMTSCDDTARSGSASHIFVNATPEAYEVWLRGVVDATKRDLPAGERLLFINSWNDWAGGAHLEPDQKFGRAYLEATRRALRGTSNWQTLVEYATSREEMSGAVLANWISDVAALLKGQELSWRHLVGLQQERLGTGHADTIAFSKVDSRHSSPTSLQQGGHGNLEHVNDQKEPSHVEVDRGTPVYLGGWSFTEGVHLGSATPTVLIMENEETLEHYEATLPSRRMRDDVVAYHPSIPASSTAFSGFAVYADVRRLQKGTYRLEVHHEVDGEAIRFTFSPRLQLV
jgi:hypothetical protein